MLQLRRIPWSWFLLLLVGCLLAGLLAWSLAYHPSYYTFVKFWGEQHPFLCLLGYAVLLGVMVFTSVPWVLPAVFLGGYFFGSRLALPVVVCSEMVATWLLFLTASRYWRSRPQTTCSDSKHLNVGLMKNLFSRSPWLATLWMRVLPFMPLGGSTLLLAWLRCPRLLFLIATFIGVTFTTSMETSLGHGLAGWSQSGWHSFTDSAVWLPSLVLLGFSLGLWLWRHLLSKTRPA